MLGWATWALPPHGDPAGSGRHCSLLTVSETWWLTAAAVLSKTKVTLQLQESVTFFFGYIFHWAYCFCCRCFPPPLWGVLVGLSRALEWWKKRLWVVFWKNQLTGIVPFSIFLILEKHNNVKLLVTFHCFNNCVIHTIHCIALC